MLDIDQRAFLAAIKDRKAAGLPVSPAALPAAPQQQQDASSGPVRELLIDSATMAGLRTSSGFSNASWPVGKEVLDFFWGELALSEGAPFECLTPDGQAKVRLRGQAAAVAQGAVRPMHIGPVRACGMRSTCAERPGSGRSTVHVVW